MGARGGENDRGNEEDFQQYELFATYRLPGTVALGSDLLFGYYLEGTAGWLRGAGETGFVGGFGPGAYLHSPGTGLGLWVGINPTLVSRHLYGKEDLGGAFHFTSHIELSYDLSQRWSLGFRFHHMSNNDFYQENPGIDMFMLQAAYRF